MSNKNKDKHKNQAAEEKNAKAAGVEDADLSAPTNLDPPTGNPPVSLEDHEKSNPPPKAQAKKATMGRFVVFHQEKTGSIGQIESFPALVLGDAAKESNFKPEDMALDLKVFKRSRFGGDVERQGVMYSHEPKAGRWTWPVQV